jgi:hypothetical protein
MVYCIVHTVSPIKKSRDWLFIACWKIFHRNISTTKKHYTATGT